MEVDAGKVWEAKTFPMYEFACRRRRHRLRHDQPQQGPVFALDAKTGATRWTSPPRQTENASITAAAGRLWCLTSEGGLIVIKADPAAYAEAGRLDVASSATWASPVLLGPPILVKDVDHLRLVRIG